METGDHAMLWWDGNAAPWGSYIHLGHPQQNGGADAMYQAGSIIGRCG